MRYTARQLKTAGRKNKRNRVSTFFGLAATRRYDNIVNLSQDFTVSIPNEVYYATNS